MSQLNSLVRLQQRSFGGEDVATQPDNEDSEWWPQGPLLPGVDQLIADFRDRVRSASPGLSVYFLLGGAGNGKSFAARALAHSMGVSLRAHGEGLARRTYETEQGEVSVVLLNDATIAPHDDYGARQNVALAIDLKRWWQRSKDRPLMVFCCINRGIVNDEIRAADGEHNIGAEPHAVLQWLVRPEGNPLANLGESPAPDQRAELKLGEHYREQSVFSDGRPLRLFALAVDSSSLMTPDAGETQSRGETLFAKILSKCVADADARPEHCPIRANVEQLRDPAAGARWNSLLDAAEIASGRLFSYRDLWGAISLSILGPRVADHDTEGLATIDRVDAWLERVDASERGERLDALLRLSRFRFHNSIFRAPFPVGADAAPEYPPATPFYAGLSMVDPSAWGNSDSPTIELAMQAISIGELPSAHLPEGVLTGAWSPFDAKLELELVNRVVSDDCPDHVRRRLISWFGGYLSRLTATVSGSLGNAEPLAIWRACREACANGPSTLPADLHAAIRGLLFPAGEGTTDHQMLVPAFAVRMEPIPALRDGQTDMLVEAINYAPVAIQVRRIANRLVVETMIAGRNKVVGVLALDLALVREALAWRAARSGQSDSTGFIEPRIERCRAATLASLDSSQRQLIALVDGASVELRQ